MSKTNKLNVYNDKGTRVSEIPLGRAVFVIPGAIVKNSEELTKRVLQPMRSGVNKLMPDTDIKIYGVPHDYPLMSEFGKKIAHKITEPLVRNNAPDAAMIAPQLFIQSYFNAYTRKLFNMIFMPRISDEKGKRLDVQTAKANIRGVIIFAHCYGRRIANRFDTLLSRRLRSLGYSQADATDIQKQLVILSESSSFSFVNTDKMKSTVLSVVSASDHKMPVFGHICKGDSSSFITVPKNNLIIVPAVYSLNHKNERARQFFMMKEHWPWALAPTDNEVKNLVPAGIKTIYMLNAVFEYALKTPYINSKSELMDLATSQSRIEFIPGDFRQTKMAQRVKKHPSRRTCMFVLGRNALEHFSEQKALKQAAKEKNNEKVR